QPIPVTTISVTTITAQVVVEPLSKLLSKLGILILVCSNGSSFRCKNAVPVIVFYPLCINILRPFNTCMHLICAAVG
ncbi:MAG TPA: hypothetical protein PKD90_13020, partial [Phnomibacter sp.]|nr:hypothetical protein [Phnomibacter sp.]